jgi:putative resolvase
MSKLTISEAAKLKGVATSTLRRWEAEGKLIPERAQKGHRHYYLTALLEIKAELSDTIGYYRIFSQDQKDDLTRQDI